MQAAVGNTLSVRMAFMNRMHRTLCWCSGICIALAATGAFAQQGGGGFGGGGGGGGFGGGGGGGMGGGNTGFGTGNQTSLNSMTQSPQSLPTIMKRSIQGTFGTRQLGSGQRQRYRGFMGSSQTGAAGGPGQYASSGAFTQARRGTLPGSGLSTFNSFANTAGRTGMQQVPGQGQNQVAQNRPQSGTGGRRVTVRVGFQPQGPAATEIATNLQRTLQRVQTVAGTASISGRSVVLSGTAASYHDRQLAETLAMLEPGVDQVQNNIVAPLADMPNVGGNNTGVEVGSGNIPVQRPDNEPPPPQPK